MLRESAERFVGETYNADHRRRLANDPLGFSADDLETIRRTRLAGAADCRGAWRARRRRGRDRHPDGSVRARAGFRALSLDRRDRRGTDRRMRQRGAEAGAAAQDRRRFTLSRIRAFGTRGAVRSGRGFDHGAEDAAGLAPRWPEDRRARRQCRRADHRFGADRRRQWRGRARPVPGAGGCGRSHQARFPATRRRPGLQHRTSRMSVFQPTPCSATAAMRCR